MILTASCATTRDETLADRLNTVIEEWEQIRPTNVGPYAGGGFERHDETHTNSDGSSTINVVFGRPAVSQCRDCETFTFQKAASRERLLVVVVTRRFRASEEALTLATRLWREFAEQDIAVNASVFSSSTAPLVKRTASVRRHGKDVTAELLLVRDETLYAVRLSFDVENHGLSEQDALATFRFTASPPEPYQSPAKSAASSD